VSFLRSHVFAILLIVALAGVTAGLYPNLPDPVPTHWSLSGKPDGFMPKPWGAIAMPLTMVGVYLLLLVLPRISPRGFAMDRFAETWGTVRGFLMLFLFFVGLIALLAAAGEPIPMDRALLIPMGLLLALLGNFMGKFTRNFFVGIRTPWTLANEEVWLRTHRLGGKVFVLCGLGIAAAGLLGAPFSVVLAAVMVAALIPIVYSYVIYRRLEGFKNGQDQQPG
jgi:uncharacterized membrane protein